MLDVYTFLYTWNYRRTEHARALELSCKWALQSVLGPLVLDRAQVSEGWSLAEMVHAQSALQVLSCLLSSDYTPVEIPPTSTQPLRAGWRKWKGQLLPPSFLNRILHLGLQTAFICCLKYLNQNFSFHGNTKNVNLHYTEINATGFTLLKRDTERQEHLFLLQLIKAPAQLRSKHDLDCLLWPTGT